MRARLFLLGALLCLGATGARAQLAITAESDPDASYIRYSLVFGKVGSRTSVGQSFVATVSGILHTAYLNLYCDASADQPLDASVYLVEEGVPTQLVATAATDPVRFPVGEVGLVGFDFSSSSAKLRAGSTYALMVTPHELKTQGQLYPHALMIVWAPSPTPYPDGIVYDSWNAEATFEAKPAADAQFRVIVDQTAPVDGSSIGSLKGSFVSRDDHAARPRP